MWWVTTCVCASPCVVVAVVGAGAVCAEAPSPDGRWAGVRGAVRGARVALPAQRAQRDGRQRAGAGGALPRHADAPGRELLPPPDARRVGRAGGRLQGAHQPRGVWLLTGACVCGGGVGVGGWRSTVGRVLAALSEHKSLRAHSCPLVHSRSSTTSSRTATATTTWRPAAAWWAWARPSPRPPDVQRRRLIERSGDRRRSSQGLCLAMCQQWRHWPVSRPSRTGAQQACCLHLPSVRASCCGAGMLAARLHPLSPRHHKLLQRPQTVQIPRIDTWS